MDDDNSLKSLTHILGIIAGFLGPLIVMLSTEDEEVKKHAKYALNWQLSLLIYFFASFILVFVLIGFLFLFALIILNLIFCIIAATKAKNNELWKYPLAIPFL